MGDYTEKELINRVLNGDQTACMVIVKRYRRAVLSHISSYISQPEDAEDVCQETFQKCFHNIGSYNFDYAFSTWLYTIAENSSFDFCRKKKTMVSSQNTTSDKWLTSGMANTTPSPEENMINEQELESLIRFVQNLSVKYRRVAELRFIHEYPLEEISKELNLPLNTVKTRVRRARKMVIEEWKS